MAYPKIYPDLAGNIVQLCRSNNWSAISCIMAQMATESGQGQSKLAGEYYNYGGWKATGNQPYVELPTKEVVNGQTITVNAKFRKFNNIADGLNTYISWMATGRYAGASKLNDPSQYAQFLKDKGYYTASSSSYATALRTHIAAGNLTQYDDPNGQWETYAGAGTVTSDASYVGGSLYSSSYKREDGIAREFAYLDSKYKRSLGESKLKLSIINYTDMVSQFAQQAGINTGSYDTSALDEGARKFIDYLIGKGIPAAGACGGAGNVYWESSFNPGAVNSSSGASGLCQWLGGRKTKMISQVSNWQNNFEGQCDFMWNELNTVSDYQATINGIKGVPDSVQGASDAAKIWNDNYERPGGYDSRRGTKAAEYYSMLKANSSGGTTGTDSTLNVELKYDEPYNITPDHLTGSKGVQYYNGHKETYYSETKLPGGGLTRLNNNGRHVAKDGTIRDKDGYIAIAANYLQQGSTIMSSLGPCKVYDTGDMTGQWIDIYVHSGIGYF